MKRTHTILAVIGIALFVVAALRFAVVQTRKDEAIAYLAEYGEISDWECLGYRFAEKRSIPRWLPGVWPRSLAINEIPPDPARYAAAVRKLPRLDMIMVFVYEPMSIEIFAALGTIPCKRLDLTSTSVSDSAFQKFTQFATVEELFLGVSTITDASMTHILKFRQVRELELNDNILSDSKVLELAQLPALATLSLDERLLPETIAALRAIRPDLKVDQ
jgi:hypothetical protein